MISIKKKLASNYWISKVNDCAVREIYPVQLSETNAVDINKNELDYFFQLTNNNEIAEFTVLLSLYNILLQRYFESPNFIYSLGLDKAQSALLHHSIPNTNKTLKEYINEVKNEIQDIYKYINYSETVTQNYPFERYTQFGFSFNNSDAFLKNNLAFSLSITKIDNGISLAIAYDENFIDEAIANHFSSNFKTWLKNLSTFINQNVTLIPIIDELEKALLLETFNDTKSAFPSEKTLVDIFEEQVNKTPDNISVSSAETSISYKSLNEQANQLANYLIKIQKIKPNDFVGIKLLRNENLLISIIAVLKAGATYVPLDVNYPQERINYIEEDSNCTCIIDEDLVHDFFETREQYKKENIQIQKNSSDLAYIIYTSGTTGKPKGVMISHQNAVAMLQWAWNEYNPEKIEVVYAPTSHCFDLSVYEMFFTLSIGKRIRLFESALELGPALKTDKNILLNLVPSSMRNILDSAYSLENVNIVNLAGEPFPVDIAQKLLKIIPEIRNLYGPSEDTTYSTCYKLSAQKSYTTIPIGKPIINTKAYVLDEELQLVPVGIVGKLYLSGAGVAKGYLNKLALTTAKFIDDPFTKGAKMYDTGDLAKWMPDGNLAFLGRKDHQVKLRGYRIELQEIESVMGSFSDSIGQVVVAVKQHSNQDVLVSYYQATQAINESHLRAFLNAKLPAYMVPSHFIKLKNIPLTPNGKIDKTALPEIEISIRKNQKYLKPSDDIEVALVNIWEEVLGVSPIGINDHFFELGGHSLMISQIINSIYKTLQKNVSYKLFYSNPTIRELKAALKDQKYLPIPEAPASAMYPLTASQKRLWVLSQLEGGSKAYNMSTAIKLKGAVDVTLFEGAVRKLIERHEILRTLFQSNESGEVYQQIISIENIDFKLTQEDYTKKSKKTAAVTKYINDKKEEPFNLANAPLLRASMIKINKEEFIFLASMHHIIGDGWSFEILMSELISIYNNLSYGEPIDLPKLNIQYKDYAVWLNEGLQVEKQKASEKYWLKQLSGELPILELPIYKTRPRVKTYNGGSINYSYSNSFLNQVKSFSKAHNVTMFMTLMSGINALLYRYTNQEDIILGTPIAGREHPDLENQIGLYLNTLAIRTKIEKRENFKELLARQRTVLLEAYENQSYPFDELVGKLDLKRDTSRSALFDVMVILNSQQQVKQINPQTEWSALEVSHYALDNYTAQFDLSFTFVEKEELLLEIEYNTDIYERSFVIKIFKHFEKLLTQLLTNPNTAIEGVNLLTEAELYLYKKYNDTGVSYPENTTVIDLFDQQVKNAPNAIALVFEKERISYQELDEKSKQLAYYLQQQGVSNGAMVPICVERSLGMIIGILGILKAGGAYVPIDATYPLQRIEFILKDTEANLILIQEPLSEIFENIQLSFQIVYLDRLPASSQNYNKSFSKLSISPEQLMYIIYTSGTTGRPKGVMITHSSLLDYVHTFSDYFALTNKDSVLQQASIAFDTSLEEIFPVLTSGGRLVIANYNNDFAEIIQSCKQEEITILSTHPYLIQYINEHHQKGDLSLRILISGGDVLKQDQLNNIVDRYNIYNTYGPTESTVCVSYFKVENCNQAISIGAPISNRQIYILNDDLQLQAEGVPGELYVGGKGLAIAYLNRPDLTAQKFIDNPFIKGEQLYKTGDLARWMPDGNVEFLGRKDHQVKIRGFRIELGEIEALLNEVKNIEQSVVLAREDKPGFKELVAYIVGSEQVDHLKVQNELAKKLPVYMVPKIYVALDKIPLNHNGKIDRKALPVPDETAYNKQEYVAPRTNIEKQLARIWEEILEIEKVGLYDNFFDLGGHSLIVGQVVNRIQKELGKTISFQAFFSNPTIHELIDQLKKDTYDAIPKVPNSESYSLTASQKRLWLLSQLEGASLAYNMPMAIQLKGQIKGDLLAEAFKKLISRHEILRSYFKTDINGEVRQYVLPVDQLAFKISIEDFTRKRNKTAIINKYINQKNEEYFDLSKAPLLRGILLKTKKEEAIFLVSMHHIIGDGWSMELLISELINIYNALSSGESINLDNTAIQYKDYVAWLNEASQIEKQNNSEQYWLNKFAGELPVLELPSYNARPLIKTYRGASIVHRYSNGFLKELKSFSKTNDVTLFMMLSAGVKVLLNRYTNQDDIIIGTPVAGRDHPDLENQIGLFLNTLAIRSKLESNQSFKNVLSAEKEILLEAYEHQNYPLDKLVSKLNLNRDPSRSALFDVMIVLQSQERLKNLKTQNKLIGLDISEYEIENKTAQLDLSLIFRETNELELTIMYNTDIYNVSLIDNLFVHLEELFKTVIEKPDIEIQNINFLSKEEEEFLLKGNCTKLDYPKEKTVIDLFEEQVLNTPENIAVAYNNRYLTYKELDNKSNQLAHYLIQHYDIKSEDLIAVKIDRSEILIITLLAILKTGAAYVPIDPTYPTERIKYIEADCASKLTIDPELFAKIMDQDFDVNLNSEKIKIETNQLAYVIYTSGSTGKPKGVMVEHGSLVNLCFWHNTVYNVSQNSNGTLFSGVGFDASVWEIYPYLIKGATLYPITNDALRYDIENLSTFLLDQNISHTYLPTLLCQKLVESEIALPNTTILTGGESLKLSKSNKLHLYNNYGPTENTVVASFYKVKNELETSIPIGKPVSNQRIYILGDNLDLKAKGVVGELCIAGDGLARGYLNDPELTKAKFISDPFHKGERMYLTGDLAKWMPDGNILFVGRKDKQIKIRGHRIELGEIDHAIMKLGVEQVVSIVKEIQNEKLIISYLVGKGELNKKDIRTGLTKILPDYMVPAYLIELESIPLTSNGKVNTRALPEIVETDIIKKAYVAPKTPEEEGILTIWQEVLGIENIGTTDNFFELGGHSLLISRVINKIQKELKKKVSYNNFFSNPTIEGLSACLEDDEFETIPKAPVSDSYNLTPSQNRLWVLSQLDGGELAYNVSSAISLKGKIDKALLEESFRRLIDRHEILRTSFKMNDDGVVKQFIIPSTDIDFKLAHQDFSNSKNKNQAVSKFLSNKNEEAFDFSIAPLLNGTIIKLEKEKHILFFGMHHIIGDAWSLEIFIDECIQIYESLLKDTPINLTPLNLQYKDYAEWLVSSIQNKSYQKSEIYWLNIFQGELPVLDLPSYKGRPPIKTFNGDSLKKTFSKSLLKKLWDYCNTHDATLFVVLMAAVNTLLHKYSNERDIIVGIPVAGRSHENLDKLIGLFLNTLAIRTKIEKQDSISDLIKNQKQILSDAYDHQEYPFSELVSKLNLKRDVSRSALFDVMVNMPTQTQLNSLTSDERIENLKIENYNLKRNQSQFDLNFTFRDAVDLELIIEYNTDIYETTLVERMFLHLEQILLQFIEAPTMKITALNCLTIEEQKIISIDFNDTKKAYSKEKTILDLFEEQVTLRPEKDAIVDSTKSYSYQEADRLSDKVATYINEETEIVKNTAIAVLMERSADMLIVLLGILKSGRAYIPLDPHFPVDRLNYILKNSQTQLLISETKTKDTISATDLKVINSKDLLSAFDKEIAKQAYTISPSDTAYVIYTSGSTGKPKGVEIGHQSLLNFLLSMQQKPGFKPNDIFFSVTTYSFDISILEFFGPLVSGGAVYIAKQNILSEPKNIINKIKEIKPNIIQATPSFYQMLFDSNWEGDTKLKILCGGDLMSEPLAQKLINCASEVWNMYGPTETTIWSSCKKLEKPSDASNIGKPINNTQFYILDEALNLVPKATKGALYISGDGLAKGYYLNETLTAAKFINHPFEEGKLLYEVGDVGYWNESGEIKFLGRNDNQVKIRGYRIELGDIENTMIDYSENLKQVIVWTKTYNQEKKLVAYYTSKTPIDHAELKSYLQGKLPAYMIPGFFIPLDEFPLTPNGKINRKALPDIAEGDIDKREYIAPITKLDRRLSKIWEEVLGIEKIGILDNFFELGGHSLIVGQVINRTQKELGMTISYQNFFSNPTIKELSNHLTDIKYKPIPQALHSASYPITTSQKRLWILSQLDGGSMAYNMPTAIKLKGAVDATLLETSIKKLIERHEILRTSFKAVGEEIRQYILPIDQLEFILEQVDFTRKRNKTVAINNYINEKNNEVFDLTKSPLLRGSLIKIKKNEFIFLASMHHIVGDGWSFEILISELVNIYNNLRNEESVNLPTLNIQYKDYAVWLKRDLQIEDQKRSEVYWLKQFSGELPVLELPVYKARPRVKTYNGETLSYRYSNQLLTDIKSFSKTHEVTMFMTLMSGINALLYRYTNQKDIIVGTPIAGREHPDLENQIGLYVNTLAIRTEIGKGSSFEELLANQKSTLLEAYENQNYPFDELVDKLDLKRDTSRSALFDIMVVLQNQEQLTNVNKKEKFKDLEVDTFEFEHNTAQFDIRFTFVETDKLILNIEYNTDIYESSFISRIFSHFENLLKELMADPKREIGAIDYITASERIHLLVENNKTNSLYPREKTIVDLVEEQVLRSPKAIAVLCEDRALSYEWINECSNQLAHYLQDNFKINTEELIGVKLERNEWLLIALLGILKSGGAYVPIDPKYPTRRIHYIEQDSNCKLTIDENFLTSFKHEREKYSIENPRASILAKNLAYIIYTSGSTGLPKGVMLEHGNAVSMLSWAKAEYANTDYEILYAPTSYCFDLSVYEFFYPLSIGKPLRILKDGLEIEKYLKNEEKVLINTVPSVIQALTEKGLTFEGVTAINMAGEPVPVSLSHSLRLSEIEVRNLYGPSEDTTYSSCYRIENSFNRSIPIGRPLSNTQFYILSEQLSIQPEGVVGELCIAGTGLSRGYMNRPELTAEKFIANPNDKNRLMYKTGDLARWLPDGNIDFIGRKDNQVKLRGYRIELGEIEHVLQEEEKIKQAVVLIKEFSGEKNIVAYLTGEEIDIKMLRNHLSDKLPGYMIPAHFLIIDKIPLTPNGKTDKKQLQALEVEKIKTSNYVAPESKLEKQIAGVWEEVLGIEKIGLSDNFFDLGGHSLKAIRLINELEKKGYLLKIKDIFEFPTIAGILMKLEEFSDKLRITKAPYLDAYPVTSSQLRVWTLSQFDGGNSAYNITNVLQIDGSLKLDLLQQALDQILIRHESLRTYFETSAEGLKQFVLPIEELKCNIEIYKTDETDQINSIIDNHTNHRFDLAKAPLLKLAIINIATDRQLLLFNLHHIVGDGWSMELLSREMVSNYNKLIAGVKSNEASLPIQYKDYAYWLNTHQQEELQNSKTYWHKQLAGELPVLELPVAKYRPKIKTYNGANVVHSFSAEFTNLLKEKVQEQEATLFVGLLAGINGLLYRYTGQKDILLGTPVAGRNQFILENQIGLYLNTLSIRTRFESTDTYDDLIQKQKAVLFDSYAHQDYPFDTLVDELPLKRDTSRSALFDILVVLHNQQDLFKKSVSFVNTTAKQFPVPTNDSSQFDITFSFVEELDRLELSVTYNTDIYTEEVIENIITYLEQFILEGIRNSDHSIAKINYLSKEEKQRLLPKESTNVNEDQLEETIIDFIEKQCEKTPNANALIFENKALSYKELNEKSNQLAHYLINNHKIISGDFVGIKLERNDWLVIAIVAVLKTGAIYVPIDINYPEERIRYIEENSKCKISITHELLTDLEAGKLHKLTPPNISIQAEDLAYIIYTSGSTGKPKGVMLSHANVASFLHWCKKEFSSLDFEILYAATSHCFDLSVYEMFFPLSVGKALRILPSGLSIGDYIEEDSKILINTVPSVVENMLKQKLSLNNVSAINMAGEPIPISLSNTLCDYPIELRNLYGPSEDTTYSTCFHITKKHNQALSIGKPIDDTRFYILSEELALQGEGLVGEICISGKGLSKGYLYQPELTAEKFIDNPFEPGMTLYKTGDLGYWMPDGNIGFIGRKDHQVKLRGYRIELGEIEHALQEENEINNAVVLIKEVSGNKYIVAYVTGEEIELEQLRVTLSEKLPGYMVPSHFLILEDIPRTPNGKTDKSRLLALEVIKANASKYVEPQTEIQKQLVTIWEEILNVSTIGILDNFFELGGHSLHITRMLYEINETFDVKLKMNNVFSSQNIQDLAQLIKTEKVFNKGVTVNKKEISKNTKVWEI